MKAATFNANSIRARLPHILSWLEQEQPDLLLLQETKVQDKEFPAEALQGAGYRAVFRGQKGYNGVAIVSKRELEDVRTGLTEGEEEEARFLSGRLNRLTVVNVYVPQGFAPDTERFLHKLTWLQDLYDHLDNTYSPEEALLLAGDFNVALEDRDVYDPEALRGQVGFHPDEQEALHRLLGWGLIDLFREREPGEGHYTFWDYRVPNGFKRNMGWRIDYLLATRPLAERSRRVWIDRAARGEDRPSDHTFLAAEFELP